MPASRILSQDGAAAGRSLVAPSASHWDGARTLELATEDELHIAWAGLVSQRGEPGPLVIESPDCHCLLFVLRGALDAELDGRPLRVPEKQTLLVWPGERCASRMAVDTRLLAAWLYFKVRRGPPGDAKKRVAVPRLTTVRNPERMAELFRLLTEEYHEHLAEHTGEFLYCHLPASLLLLSLLARLGPAASGEPAPRTPCTALVERACDYIRFHSDRPITVADLAREMECSRAYLRTAFRKAAGQSPSEILQRTRLQNARRFLVTTRMAVGQIAEKCGFSSLNYFTRVFTRIHGMTPSAYRAANSRIHATPGI